jgi:hypothetical protein
MKLLRHISCSFVVAAAAVLSVPAHAAMDVAGVKFEDTARVANQDLKLNGAGVRTKVIFKVYAAGLYLQDKKTTVPDVLAVPGAKRIAIVMLRDISSEEFGRAFIAGIHANIDKADKAKIVSQLLKFGELFAAVPEIKKGDILTTDWIPGTGTVMTINGKKMADPFPDVLFYNALLKIWLGEKPVDARLKHALLGEKAEEAPRRDY